MCIRDSYNATRKLVVENPAAGIRYFLVKPSDVAIYVEHGAADVDVYKRQVLVLLVLSTAYVVGSTNSPFLYFNF